MNQFAAKLHRDLPPTRLWGFNSSSPGPMIEAWYGEPFLVEWVNTLPHDHFLPLDYSLHGAGRDVPSVRTVVHLHGGRVPPESDGYPEHWFTPGESRVVFYPNSQEATMLWYHDHSMAITRLNMFAGLFGLYVIRDEFEKGLDLPVGAYELPLVFYDRSIRLDGQLHYPVSGDPTQPWMPEFFGDAIVVNGKLFPFCEIEPRRYRLRILNASNSRFLYLSFSDELVFHQIGSDQGMLPQPVELKQITLAPAERADLLVDFSGYQGRQAILRSDQYQLVQFRVANARVSKAREIPRTLRPVSRIPEHGAERIRILTLGGGGDPDDPTSVSGPMLLNDAYWHDPLTENPRLGTVEIWSFVNVTDDSHPIHLHLVRFQVLDRRPFDLFTFLNERKLHFTAPAIPPNPEEAGWKDTVRADPGMVTRIIVPFEPFAGRYVWHCHVLEHEDNEMMRPYEVMRPV